MTGIYLLLGSNLGDRRQQLQKARAGIMQRVGPIISCSSVYNSAPWGNLRAGDFLNQVIEVNTRLNPHALLYHLISLEISAGRQFQESKQSRYLDIDILYYQDLVITSNLLSIPHVGIPNRRFLLEPMVEIAAKKIHPVLRLTQKQLLDQCTDALDVRKYLK